MTSKKICDKCKVPALDAFVFECEYCGGSSFTHVRTDDPNDVSNFQSAAESKSVVFRDNYNPSIIDGLLDTTFEKYTTRRLASFTYKVALFVMGIIVLTCSIFLLWAIFNQNTTFPVLLGVLLGIVLVFLFALIWLASLRLRLESFTALVQIAKNTLKSE
jgi:hypothetical protein